MKKLLAFAVAILMAAPAFAAVQNVKVSGNVTSTYVSRSNFDFNQSVNQYKTSAFLTQATLNVDADLSDNVSTKVGLINERAWGNTTETGNQNTSVDLYLAYVTLREFLYSPLTVTVGRQVFAFGNSLVFDATGTNNGANGPLGSIARDLTMRSSLDAIRATFDYKPLTVDVFYGSLTQANVQSGGQLKDNQDVYGINANYQLGNESNTVIEAYIFGRHGDKGSAIAPTAHHSDNLYAPGLRVSTTPIKGLNMSAEGALQLGNDQVVGGTAGSEARKHAYALQGVVSYAIENKDLEKYKPVVSGSYTYVSGDKRNGTNHKTDTAWDPFLENQGGGTIYNSILNLTNLQIINVTLSANPLQDVTASLSWNGLVAAEKLNAGSISDMFTDPDGTGFAPTVLSGNSKRGLGNEYDANVSYAYTEDVKFGLNLGWLVPGSAFAPSNSKTASQAIASVGVNF